MQLRILHLEDDPRDVDLIRAMLESEGIVAHVTRVDGEAEFRAALERKDFDLILADYSLPSFDGMSALRLVRERSPGVPFIFVSGTLSEELVAEAIKIGATDYVLKERASRVVPAVQRALREADERAKRARAEEAARIAQARFEGIVENAHDAIISVDAQQRIVLFNSGAEKSFGYARSEVLGRPLDLLLPRGVEDVHRTHIAAFARSPDGERAMAAQREVSGRRKDGSEFPVEASISKLDVGGDVLFTAFLRDITDRKRAAEAIERSAKELRDVIDTIPAMVFATRPDGSTEFVNRRWREYLGLATEDTIGFGWLVTVHPEDLESHMEKWRASLASGAPFESEARHRGAGGEYRWFLVRAVPLRDEAGTIVRWYGKLLDVTERRRAEEALRQAQAALAHVTRVSTLGEVAGSIAHEVNQPLAAIANNANASLGLLPAGRAELGEVRDALADIAADAARAGAIIERVRALAKRSVPEQVELRLSDVVNDVLALAATESARRRVAIRTDIPADLAPVVGDRVQLQQVLLNLIVNGMEAMNAVGDSERRLEIRGQTELDRGTQTVRISVADRGIGLDDGEAERLFETFYTTKPQGMGLGLAISRSIIEAHGGRLWAASNGGIGATFSFRLPAAGNS